MSSLSAKNKDSQVIADFGQEWAAYGKTLPSDAEHRRLFEEYFSIFPFESLPATSVGFDAGCGSGRWADFVAEKVGKLHCIDPAPGAMETAKRLLSRHNNVVFHNTAIGDMPLESSSQDFGYSIGVLHHIPDAARALRDCTDKLKPGAPFLLYLYYRFDNRPGWFVALWRLSDWLRRIISRMPFALKRGITDTIALLVYWPLSRIALLAARLGLDAGNFPLGSYKDADFQTLRNDSLDRFGTRLEQRFTRREITDMMLASGLEDIRFREDEPYWVAVGKRS